MRRRAAVLAMLAMTVSASGAELRIYSGGAPQDTLKVLAPLYERQSGTVDPGRLTTFPFRTDRFQLVVAQDHPLAGRNRIAFADALGHDFIGLDRASAVQRFLAGKATSAGRALRLRVQLRSFDAVCRLVERNVGVGVVPATTARQAVKTMAIKALDLSDPWALRELTICVRDFNALPHYAQKLVEHMRATPH